MDMNTETARPQTVETTKMARRNVSATVVALTPSAFWYTNVMARTMPRAAAKRKARLGKRARMDLILA